MDARVSAAAAPSVRARAAGRRRTPAPWLFLAPFGVLFLTFFIAPILYAAASSLFAVRRSGLGFGPSRLVFVGMGNYLRALADVPFREGVWRVLAFGCVQIPVMLGLALGVALVLDEARSRLARFARATVFLPYAVPTVVGALVWGFLYEPSLSPIVRVLHGLHLPAPDFLGASTVLWSIANITTWQWTGYNMLIFLASLQAIPRELYEASRMDGCGPLRLAWYVKIPLVLPTVVMTAVLSIIGTLQLFNEPAILRQISTSVGADYTPNLHAYTVAFVGNDHHYAAALAVMLAAVTFAFSLGFMRLVRRFSGL